jgi:hypothetical protein
MTRISKRTRHGTALSRSCTLTVTVALCTALFGSPALSQADCPTTPAELSSALQDDDAAARTQAAECFVEQAVFFDFSQLKHVVDTMLRDDAPEVRFYGLSNLQASYWAELTTGGDLRIEKTKIMQILNEDPVGRNKAAAAVLIGAMDPVPVNQAQEPLLDLLSHPEAIAVQAAFDVLLRFDEPPEQEISQALMGMTGHNDPNFRGFAYRGLGRLYEYHPGIDPEVVGSLAVGLGDESRNVQWQAANSLRMFGIQAAAAEPELQAVVWDPKQPSEVREIAQEAVETITGAPITPPWLGQPPPPSSGAGGSPQ